MKGTVEEDRISSSPARVGMLEEKLFSVFEAVRKNKDYIAMKSICAIDVLTKIDERLDGLSHLHETFKMSVLPDGGLKWMVLGGREKMGNEIARLSPLCQDFYDKLIGLLEKTCGQKDFSRAGPVAKHQLKRLTSDNFTKPFQRDIWAPQGDKLASYLGDDDWFRGFGEGLSNTLLGLVASAAVLKGAYMEELDMILSGTAEKMARLENAALPVPEEFLARMRSGPIDRQRRIFINIGLAHSEAILEKYRAEAGRFITFADTVVQVRDQLEFMVRRTILYNGLFEMKMDFSHPELDSYIGYLPAQDRTEGECAYIARHMLTRRAQLDAQKRYYLMNLWRSSPQQMERVRSNAAAEYESFRRSEKDTRSGISELVRMLKGHGREHHAQLMLLEGFDAEADTCIEALAAELDDRLAEEQLVGALVSLTRPLQTRHEEQLAGALVSLTKALQTRQGEFLALAGKLREDVSRMVQMVEAGSLPAQSRPRLLEAAGDFNDIALGCEWSPVINERYCGAVQYYKDLQASRNRLGGLCLQSIRSDIAARCRELEGQDRRYAGLLASVLDRFKIPEQFGGPGVADLLSRYEQAQEHIYKEVEGFIFGYRGAVLEGGRGRIEKAQRVIVLDQMRTKLDAIASFVPRRPAQPSADVGALEKMRQELFGQDLLLDAQQYWMNVRELCEAISASIRIHMDVSMITEEDRKAGWEVVLDRLDARFLAILVTVENRLKELDSVLGRIPEFCDVRLAARPAPELKNCDGDGQKLPVLRLRHLEGIYSAIHSTRQKAVRQFGDLSKALRERHLPSQFGSSLDALAENDLDAALVGFAAFRSSLREWLKATIDTASKELEFGPGGKWEMPDGATAGSWLDGFGEFMTLFSQRARSDMEEASALCERMAGSEELGRIKRKLIGGCRMRELLEASDTTEMKEISYLLFHGEHDMEAARRDIELALNRHDIQGVIEGCRRWTALQRRLETTAVTTRDIWKSTLLEALGGLEDRRLREYNLSRNKAGFQDRGLIEDVQRAALRCRLRDKKLTTREFNKLMRTLHKDRQVHLTDRSDAMFMIPGDYPDHGLTVEVSEQEPDTTCTANVGDLCLEFTYQPKKMLLVLKGS